MIQQLEVDQQQFLDNKDVAERKILGQFFTGGDVATFMAGMIDSVPAKTRILDAGAGAGILTHAAAMRCLELGSRRVYAVLYEIDGAVLPELKKNMLALAELFADNDREFSCEIREKDFVLDRPDLRGERFDLSCINPPYFKYNSKDSVYSGATADLFRGNPNIYASFMAVVAACLEKKGQMISIVPRSFTNGLYFKDFRRFLGQHLSLQRVHVFKSRNKVFRQLSVLQENIICKHTRSREQINEIALTRSQNAGDLGNYESFMYPAELIVDSSNELGVIRLPESALEADILLSANNWRSSFSENGYFISTGPVVEHRTRDLIVAASDVDDSIPLIRMHNCKLFDYKWTGDHKKDARLKCIKHYQKHTVPNRKYIFLKRFSSKDEKRRLTATIFEPEFVNASEIAIENHLNYLGHSTQELSKEELTGLAVLLNSSVMDKYFRCISGNTQVNATEVRLMKMPSRDVISKLGYDALKLCENLGQKESDEIIENNLKNF